MIKDDLVIKLRLPIIMGLLMLVLIKTTAQVSILGGANYCDVRNNHLLENQRPIFAYHYGLSVRYYPFKKLSDLSIQNELLFNRKGYQQNLDKNYQFQFSYISLPVLMNYALVRDFSIHTGVEISRLLYTNMEHGTETYNRTDFGIILGFGVFDKKRVSIYARYSYGFIPMLDYYSFDKVGNFVGKVHDLKNSCVSIGLKINIYDEEIHIYK